MNLSLPPCKIQIISSLLRTGSALFNTGSLSLACCPAHSRCLLFVHGINEASSTASNPQTLPHSWSPSSQTLLLGFSLRRPTSTASQQGKSWPPSRAGSRELQCQILVTRGRSLLRFPQGFRSFLPFRGHQVVGGDGGNQRGCRQLDFVCSPIWVENLGIALLKLNGREPYTAFSQV